MKSYEKAHIRSQEIRSAGAKFRADTHKLPSAEGRAVLAEVLERHPHETPDYLGALRLDLFLNSARNLNVADVCEKSGNRLRGISARVRVRDLDFDQRWDLAAELRRREKTLVMRSKTHRGPQFRYGG